MSTPEQQQHMYGAAYTAVRAAHSNNVAIHLIRIVLGEMYQAVKADKPIDPVHPDVWAETIDWVCERMGEDNDEVLQEMRKAGHGEGV